MNKPLYHKDNNKAMVKGVVASPFVFHHEAFGEKFYLTILNVIRLSDEVDKVFVLVSDRLADVTKDYTGMVMQVHGQLRTFAERDGNETMKIYVEEGEAAGTCFQLGKIRYVLFATDVEEVERTTALHDNNKIVLQGFICRQPVFRKPTEDTSITDLMLAVNRAYGKSDYIPCIVWGRNAKYASELEVGDKVAIIGRLQSRKFPKKNPDGTPGSWHMTWEVSISQIEDFEESNRKVDVALIADA